MVALEELLEVLEQLQEASEQLPEALEQPAAAVLERLAVGKAPRAILASHSLKAEAQCGK